MTLSFDNWKAKAPMATAAIEERLQAAKQSLWNAEARSVSRL